MWYVDMGEFSYFLIYSVNLKLLKRFSKGKTKNKIKNNFIELNSKSHLNYYKLNMKVLAGCCIEVDLVDSTVEHLMGQEYCPGRI